MLLTHRYKYHAIAMNTGNHPIHLLRGWDVDALMKPWVLHLLQK